MLATVGVLVQSFVHFPDPDRSAFSNTRPIGALVQVCAIWRVPCGACTTCLVQRPRCDFFVAPLDFARVTPNHRACMGSDGWRQIDRNGGKAARSVRDGMASPRKQKTRAPLHTALATAGQCVGFAGFASKAYDDGEDSCIVSCLLALRARKTAACCLLKTPTFCPPPPMCSLQREIEKSAHVPQHNPSVARVDRVHAS